MLYTARFEVLTVVVLKIKICQMLHWADWKTLTFQRIRLAFFHLLLAPWKLLQLFRMMFTGIHENTTETCNIPVYFHKLQNVLQPGNFTQL